MRPIDYKRSEAFFLAGVGGFGVWCTTILLNVAVNAISPVRVPLWATTMLALILFTYWFIDEDRIIDRLRKRRKIAAVAEDPTFDPGDARRKLSNRFYNLSDANKWVLEQEAKGAINAAIRDVISEDELDDPMVYPAPYTRTRVKLAVTYVLAVVIIAAVIQWFIESAYPDRILSISDARHHGYREFPFWASMILTWVLLANAEFRDAAARKAGHIR